MAKSNIQVTKTETSEESGGHDTDKSKLVVQLPLSVGNPAAAASLAIDQSHMEEFTSVDEKSSVVVCEKPPKGTFFTVRAEMTKRFQDRAFYFLLQMAGRDSYIVAPAVAKERKDEDVIRPVLIVRYVTMAGEEGLWPIKLDPPDKKANSWNASALNILEVAASGRWVRMVTAKNQYRHQVSPKTLEQTPPRFSERSFQELINIAFKDRTVTSLDHEIWDVLDHGSGK